MKNNIPKKPQKGSMIIYMNDKDIQNNQPLQSNRRQSERQRNQVTQPSPDANFQAKLFPKKKSIKDTIKAYQKAEKIYSNQIYKNNDISPPLIIQSHINQKLKQNHSEDILNIIGSNINQQNSKNHQHAYSQAILILSVPSQNQNPNLEIIPNSQDQNIGIQPNVSKAENSLINLYNQQSQRANLFRIKKKNQNFLKKTPTKSSLNSDQQETIDQQVRASSTRIDKKSEKSSDFSSQKGKFSKSFLEESTLSFDAPVQDESNCNKLMPLFIKQIKEFKPQFLVLHFDNLFLQNDSIIENYWEAKRKDEDDMQQFIGKFRSDIKKFLKTLSVDFTIILILKNNSNTCRNLFLYLLRNNYFFDGVYYINDDMGQSCMTLSYNQILNDFNQKKSRISKFLIFDTISNDLMINFTKNSDTTGEAKPNTQNTNSYFSNKIPLINLQANRIKLIFFKQRQYFKSQDCSFIQNIASILVQQDEEQQKKHKIIFYKFELALLVKELKQQQDIVRKKQQYLQQIQQIIKSNRQYKFKNEQDPEKKLEIFRNNCIDYLKSQHNKVQNIYFTVGDITVRNRQFFNKVYKDNEFFIKERHYRNLQQLTRFIKDNPNDLSASSPETSLETDNSLKVDYRVYICIENKN